MHYKTILSVVLAAGMGLWAGMTFTGKPAEHSKAPSEAGSEREPLYWVAPMDASFRRDQPGKSPMGMDLVPVYADSASDNEADVRISPAVEQHLGVSTAPVTRRPLSPSIDAVGFVSFNQQTLTHFHLRASGWISNLSVNAVGDPVTEGQKLFDFYSPDIRNTQQEFLQALASDDRSLIRASRAKLVAQGVPEREIADIEKSRQIKTDIAYYAHGSGVVAELSVANGSFVSVEQNTLSVGPLEDVWVIAEVFEKQAGWLRKGQSVSVSAKAYPGEQWRGEIDYLYPVLNPDNRTTRARIVIANDRRQLQPNMLVQIRIETDSDTDMLTVPDTAVIRTGQGERVVRQLEPGVFRSTVIRTGVRAQGFTQVLEGLNEGDRVVTNAQFLIDSESSVHVELERLSQPANNERGSTAPQNHSHHSMGHGGVSDGASHGAHDMPHEHDHAQHVPAGETNP